MGEVSPKHLQPEEATTMIDNPFSDIASWEQYHDGSDQFKLDQDEKEQERQERFKRAWALRLENDTQDLY